MRYAIKAVLVAVLAAGASGAGAAAHAVAELVDAEGNAIGTARIEQAPHGVLMLVEVTGLPPGAHGIHLHGTGSCAPDFKAAKGHVNPQGVEHGLRNPNGPDAGDLPNLHVAADGTATAEFYTERVSVGTGANKPALLDADGSALIIHANPDDHMTQPIGGAGGRIGCGVIRASNPAQAASE